MADENGGLIAEVGITLGKLTQQLAQAEARMVRTAKKMEADFLQSNQRSADSFQKIDKAAANTGIQVGRLKSIILGALSVREVQQFADAWTVANNKIAAASQVAGTSARSLSEINDIATRTRSGITETADLYAQLLRATAGVAKSEEDVARATELVNKAFKAGGAAASEQAAGILQLAQGLSSGALQGDELRSIRENAPLVAKAIADAYGVSIGELKKLGAEGELTSARVFQAILQGAPEIEAAFAKTNSTIGEGFTLLRNSLTEYVGIADNSVGATEKIVAALGFLAQNIELVVIAGTALGARFIGPVLLGLLGKSLGIITAATTGFSRLAAGASLSAGAMAAMRGALALLGGPIGVVITALAVLPALITTTGERVASLEGVSSSAEAALRAYAEATQAAADEQDKLGGAVSTATQNILNQSRAQLQDELRKLRSEYDALISDVQGGLGLAESNLEFRIEVNPVLAENDILAEFKASLAAVNAGEQPLTSLTAEVERLAGIGQELQPFLDRFDAFRQNQDVSGLQLVGQEMVGLATQIGGFDEQLKAINDAGSTSELIAAYQALRDKLSEALSASEVIRAVLPASFREGAAAAGLTEAQIDRVVAVLSDTNAALDEAERNAGGVASAAGTIDFSGAAASAGALADELLRAANNAASLAAAGVSDALKAKINFDYRDDPIGRAGALASAEFAEKTRIDGYADGPVRAVIDAEREAFVGARVEAEKYNQQLVAWQQGQNAAKNKGGRGGGGGGGGGGKGKDSEETSFFAPTQDEIERLNSQIELIGATAGQLAEYEARQRLLNEAKKQGLDLDAVQAESGKTLRAEIDAQAASIGLLTEKYDQARQKASFFEGIQGQLTDGFIDAIVEGQNFAGVLSDVAKQIAKAALQALLFGKGPLAGLFGGRAGSGLLSGIFGGGFAEGGYTGGGGKYDPAGIVHKGEYVFDQKAVRRIGLGNLQAMHRNLRGYAEGGFVGSAAPAAAPVVNSKMSVINVWDKNIVGDFLATEEGRQAFLNIARESGVAFSG